MDTYSFILEILEFVVDGISSCFVKIGETAIAQGILHCISIALWFPNQGNGFGYLSWKTANDQVQDLFVYHFKYNHYKRWEKKTYTECNSCIIFNRSTKALLLGTIKIIYQ